MLTASTEQRPESHYRQLLANDPQKLSLQYGLALASMRADEPRAAVELLLKATAEASGIPLLDGALGQAQLAAGDNEAALETFDMRSRSHPAMCRCRSAMPRRCWRSDSRSWRMPLLLDLFNNVAPTPEQIRLTALAASAAGDTGDAYYYMAEYHISSGDLMLATTQLDLALAAPRAHRGAAQALHRAPRRDPRLSARTTWRASGAAALTRLIDLRHA